MPESAGVSRRVTPFLLFPALFLLLLLTVALSIRFGALPVTFGDVSKALFDYNAAVNAQRVVRTLRLPRTIIGLAAGAGLALCGAAMQTLTRNPLAGPSILGINSGAAFAIVTAVTFGGITHPAGYIWFALIGAIGAVSLVYVVGSTGEESRTPVRLTLAGVAVSSLLSAWNTAILTLNSETLDVVRFWLAGSLAGRDFSVFRILFPGMAAGITGLLLCGRYLNILALGDDAALALGIKIRRTRMIINLLVGITAGTAVAVVGPIGFVGIAAPHIVRVFTGADNRQTLFGCLLLGPVFLLGADIAGRVAVAPSELQTGIVTAFFGAPFLIVMARRHRKESI